MRDHYCIACRQVHAVPAYEVPEPETVWDAVKAFLVLVMMIAAGYALFLAAAAWSLSHV